MARGNKSSARMALVKVTGIDGFWQTKTGGDITSEASKIYDGGSRTPDVMASLPEVADVVVGRAYDRFRDKAALKQLRQLVGSWFTEVSITDTDAAGNTYGDPTVYTDALLTGIKEFEVDSNSGEPTSWELTFTPADVVG